MTLIDWSDPEGMFGLLLDYVADERAECRDDPERRRFLSDLLAQLRKVEARLPELSGSEVVRCLRQVHESVDPEFSSDAVTVHVQDCIEELEKVEEGPPDD